LKKNGDKLLRSDGWRYIQNLNFDILVGIEEQKESGGKGELKVAGIFNVGGGLSEKSVNQNRIKFSTHIAFSTTPTPEQTKVVKDKAR
jgi:hypothetical protein